MNNASLSKYIAEFVGTAFLLLAITGAGMMGAQLAGEINALVLLAISLSAGAVLATMIAIFGPISGGHFNPAVTLVMLARGQIGTGDVFQYFIAQLLGGIAGVILANLMFEGRLIDVSPIDYSDPGKILGEVVATFGLVMTILLSAKFRPGAIAPAVGAYLFAAHWFTASTSFANPAVAVARIFNNGPAGIRVEDVIPFVVAQLAGAFLAYFLIKLIVPEPTSND